MIVTVLLILQKITEFARNRKRVNECSFIDLIDSSADDCVVTDSTIIFSNYNSVPNNKTVRGTHIYGFHGELVCLKKSKRMDASKSDRLNLITKMECKENKNKDLLNGIMTGLKGNLTSPVSDCNSNNLPVSKENILLCSTDSIQECPDFLQDNSDYQWFLDYGYKDNNYSHQQSILSLSRSQDLIYYEDMARNFDANLAEVDMDDFNREDIHSVLSSLPNIQGVEEREMFASVSGSMMVKFGFDESISPNTSSQEEQNNTTSICKSQPLFSPVHESYMPTTNLSVDSLDLSENDINLMVTCQANKHNYTIAFEGSTVMGTDDSESRETGTSRGSMSEDNEGSRFGDEFSRNRKCSQHFSQETNDAMACSDSPFTTWSKIKKNSNENLQLRRHPSGNNNTTDDGTNICSEINNASAVKSLSLPNLCRENQKAFSGLSVSVKADNNFGPSVSDCDQQCIKLYDIQNSSNSKSVDHCTSSTSGKPLHNFSLLKLFIKQKSGSHDGMFDYTKEDTYNHLTNNIKQTECDAVAAKNFQMNEMNKIKTDQSSLNVIEGNLPKKSDGQTKLEQCNSKSEQQSTEYLAKKIDRKRFVGNENQIKDDYDFCHDHKDCSDESTQENGSNTESAENLLCNCTKASSNDLKKIVIEKSIQTSKVTTSDSNFQKSQVKVPVYILYPNYSLPNLEFLKKKHYIQNIDFSKVFIRPQKFQSPSSQNSSPRVTPKRPFSVNDIETLKKTGFKHIKDWESLTFLLPTEYKQFLQEIPEIVSQLKEVKNIKEELVPLFCLSPPPNRKLKKRPISCDLNFFSNDYKSSNFSSTATQPSSGYRGSSTMLNSNTSSSTGSPRNAYGHKYDTNSESCSSRKSGFLAHSKHLRNFADVPPPRPPLPKGILRNNSLDNQQYTCKIQKENANKRYSMIELTDKNLDADDKGVKKRSVHNFNIHPSQPNSYKNNENKKPVNGSEMNFEKDTKESKTMELEETYYSEEQSKIQGDLRRLEELLEISAVFGESVESFTENDMIKLRSQVSKFLTMHKNLEKVSETLQTVDENSGNENFDDLTGKKFQENLSLETKCLHTPHNTPEHKKQLKGGCEKDLGKDLTGYVDSPHHSSNDYNSNTYCHNSEDCFNEETVGLKKTVSFAERISFAVKEREFQCEGTPLSSPSSLLFNQNQPQGKCKRSINLPISEESSVSSLADSPTRNTLLTPAEILHKKELVLDVKNAIDKILKLSQETEEDPINLCLHHLCPSLYAVLSDGLKEEIETAFGAIRNSVWSVIEASSQNGPMTQTLNELVQRLNRDDVFTEGLIKFNAFIFGLINARALSSWLSYLRTRDSLLRKYYDHSGLLLMSNTAGAPVRILVDELINALEPLSSMRFNLDLMYQTKLLHCSLQNLNHLLEEADNNAFLTPTKQFMLLKLVQSIQNSINQGGEGKKNKYLLEDIEKKTSDPPVANLLERNKSVRTRRGISKTRPRSGCDIVCQGKEINDVTTTIKKRWSGVHANSKLVEAFEKLGDDSESDYTDSLDNRKPRKGREKSVPCKTQVPTKGNESKSPDFHAEFNTKEQKKNILLNLNKKSCGKTDYKTELDVREAVENSAVSLKNGGHKFKRLQQKWEKLSRRSDSDEEIRTHSSEGKSVQRGNSALEKCPSSEKFNCDINVTPLLSPTSRVSKIPRLVTSPLSSTPSTKGSKKCLSPTSVKPSQKPGKVNVPCKGHNAEGKVVPAVTSRLSRCDEKSDDNSNGIVEKGHIARPTSLPYRGCNTMPVTKSEAIARRASSVSLNRRATSAKKLQVPRTVRTLTHRLPSDSGHLSFNEGEKLKVVLEVDKTWLLCCRGTQKGLVPKSAVISDLEGSKF